MFFVTSWSNIDQKYEYAIRDCIPSSQNLDQIFLESDYPLVAVIGVPHSAKPEPLNDSLILRSVDISERIPALSCEGRFTSEIASKDVHFDGVQAVNNHVSSEEVACRYTSLILPQRISDRAWSPLVSIQDEEDWCVLQCRIEMDALHFHDITGWLENWPFEPSMVSGGEYFEQLIASAERDSISKSRKRLLEDSIHNPIGRSSVLACSAFHDRDKTSFRCFVRIKDVAEGGVARANLYMPDSYKSSLSSRSTCFDFAFTAGRSGGRFGRLLSTEW